MTVLPRVHGDYGFNGFFDVRDPQSLFQKMQYDYGRMIAEPLNVYPAWDFFVTANHLIDWIWPSAGTATSGRTDCGGDSSDLRTSG